MKDVGVEQGGEQVVSGGHGVDVAGEVKVDVLHRHYLGEPAAGGAAFGAEAWTQAGLAQADRCLLADPVQRVADPDKTRIILTHTNAEVRDLNLAARDRLRDAGEEALVRELNEGGDEEGEMEE